MAYIRPYNDGAEKRPFNNKSGKNFGPRKNERIRAPKIRVKGPDGKQLGIMTPYEALAIARRNGLDLLEVSPTAEPPVCRILDYGKYMYEESKKQKAEEESKAKERAGQQKTLNKHIIVFSGIGLGIVFCIVIIIIEHKKKNKEKKEYVKNERKKADKN